MRRTIASRMVQAAQSIPHFYLSMDVTLDALLALREQERENDASGQRGAVHGRDVYASTSHRAATRWRLTVTR